MIDYKNKNIMFGSEYVAFHDKLQHESAYALCVLYRAIEKYKLENPDDEFYDVKKFLIEVTECLLKCQNITIKSYCRTGSPLTRKNIELTERPMHSSNSNVVYYLYSRRYNVCQGLFIDTKEYYRIALEMYMDIEVSLQGFYFYIDNDSWEHKKLKKYSLLWDIPMRKRSDLQPLFSMDKILKSNNEKKIKI